MKWDTRTLNQIVSDQFKLDLMLNRIALWAISYIDTNTIHYWFGFVRFGRVLVVVVVVLLLVIV